MQITQYNIFYVIFTYFCKIALIPIFMFIIARSQYNLLAVLIATFFFFTLNIAYSDNLFPIVQKKRVGYINSNGEVVIKPTLETYFQKSYYLYDGKYYPFYDFHENAFFSEGKAIFRKSWKILFIKFGYVYGVIDTSGQILFEPQEIEPEQFHNNRAKIKVYDKTFGFSTEKYSFMDISGNVLDGESARFDYVSDFSEAIAIILKMGKYYYIDTSGAIIIDKAFDDASSFQNGTAAVMIDSLWGVIDKSGEFIIEPKYLRIWNNSNGFFRIFDGKNYSFINNREINIFKQSFETANDFSEGFAAVKFGEFDYGFIDTLGNIAFRFDKCNGIGNFNNGLARVQIDNKWGYINRRGEFFIKPQYDYAIDFRDGFAIVWQDDKVYVMNTDGKHIWEYIFTEQNEKN